MITDATELPKKEFEWESDLVTKAREVFKRPGEYLDALAAVKKNKYDRYEHGFALKVPEGYSFRYEAEDGYLVVFRVEDYDEEKDQ